MAGSLIVEKVQVRRRYVRAVDMARDLNDPRALEGYVITPSVRDGLSRILNGLNPDSSQQAFRVTGPYGSGKSSFGLLLARLFSDTDPHRAAQGILNEALGAVAVPEHLPMILIGRRTSFADELLNALRSTAQTERGIDEEHAARATEMLEARANGNHDVRLVLDLVGSYADSLARRTGRRLILLVDEMGRYLEYSAANPASEDPSIFQLLAERAGGAAPDFAVVGFLHHRFGDYVAGLGDWMEGEWARSSERYEEIAFQESTEQTLYLLAQALSPCTQHSRAVAARAAELYSVAADRKLFTTSSSDVATAAKRLYPLHPAALACLASSARRFGQNERSVFSFLQSLEPAGFQRFVHEHSYDPDCWYRVDQLFDYLAAQGSFRFRSADRERRWQLALDALALCADMRAAELSVLKGLSVLAVLEPVPGLKADPATIAWCLGLEEQQVIAGLDNLVAKGVVHVRSTRGDYSLWSHSSVDLDRWLEDARAAVPHTKRLDEVLRALPSSRPLIAHRHYHQTGTLRTFGAVIGEQKPAELGAEDGILLVLPLHPEDDQGTGAERARQLSIDAGPLTLVRTRRITAADLAQTHELACWRWVRENCRELRIDEIARAEVDKRIGALENELLRLFAPFSDPVLGAGQEAWFREGREVDVRSRAELSRLLSDICDEAFRDAPVLRNELINRDRLSTAIAAARMRLLELMLTRESCEYLALDGAPPERTIYLSLFHASGLHAGEPGAFHFHAPPADDPKHWQPTWAKIDELVRAGGPVRFDQLIAELAKPPIGLRAGAALLIIAAYMLYNRSSIALMERNSFQPEVTPPHFMRLAKTPSNFALRHVAVTASSNILEALAGGLSIWDGHPPQTELKPLVEALYRWWDKLPEYARATRSIDARAQAVRLVLRKARDPVELLFETLPSACDALRDGCIEALAFAGSLDFALRQIEDAYPTLQQRSSAALLDAFGARSIKQLREQIDLDYQDHLLDLGDRSLRAFVDRAINPALSDASWLDGVASLVVGRRLETWEDDTLDGFSFEIRSMAQRLARRLAQIRQSKAVASPITAVHILGADGTENSMYLRVRDDEREEPIAQSVRDLIDHSDNPESLLLQLLTERISARSQEKVR